jgi:hypothetical protein
MDVDQTVLYILPRWVPVTYTALATATIPWTVYLADTLPTRHVTHHWDVAWVGLDMAIIALLILNALFASRAARWLVLSASSTTSLLVADAWFDILSSRYGRQLYQALASAAFIEIPLAILTMVIAIRTLNRIHGKSITPTHQDLIS